jgi:hypothetical protein
MTAPSGKGPGPKQRDKHYSYDESLDEAPKLIESETVEIEAEIPCDTSEPVEGVTQEEEKSPPAFEE